MNVQNTLRQYGEWDIRLKDENNKKKLDFAPVRRKIFSRIVLLMAGAFFGIWFLYQYVLQGRFADGIVRFLYDFTSMTYEDARDFYWHNIGNHFELIFFGAIALVFCLMFYFFLNSFTKYFQEIDDGINALVHHDGRQIRMSKEMAAMEEKLNSVNATLNRQLYDIQMAEKKKDELVLYLAHDIRTPLTSVIGYLKLLEEMPDISKEQQDKFIHVTLDKALRLEVLVNEFFDITRFNRQDIELATTEIDLYYMLMQLSDEVYPLLAPEHKKVEIRADENCKVYGDADKLARIFNNILKNAIAYSNPDSTIVISAWEEPPGTVILFSNQGQTISPEEQQRIFDKFYRRDEARQTNSGGAGLGLAIAKELVDLHGGTIRVMSENGRTTFKVCLPRRKMPTA